MKASTLIFSLATLVAATASAQTAKSGIQIGDVALLPQVSTSGSTKAVAGGWTTILSSGLHTSSQKDLTIGVSLEAGLYTDTLVSSQRGTKDTSNAEAAIEVQVLVDGVPVAPGPVIFARRHQQLMAKFGGVLESCTDADQNFTITASECTFSDEQLQLILDTMNANAFFFSADDVGTGDHVVEVQARIVLLTNAQNGSARASASIGKGALVVEEVRFVKDIDLTR